MSMRAALGGAAGLFLLALLARRIVGLDPTLPGPFTRIELLPYIGLVGLAIIVPLVWLAREGRFRVPHPLVHLGWTYLVPALVIGSVVYVVTGVSDTPQTLIADAAFDYRLTLLYLAIGIAAFALAVTVSTLHFGNLRILGRRSGAVWSQRETLAVGCTMLILGIAIQFLNFFGQTIGYQSGTVGPFNAFVYYLGLIFHFGIYLIWFAIFSAPRIRKAEVLAILLLVVCELIAAILYGNRGFLFSCWIFMVLACFSVTARPAGRTLAILAMVGVLSIGTGFTIGTLFRLTKAATTLPAEPAKPAAQTQAAAPPGAGTSPSSAVPAPIQPPPATASDVAQHAQRPSTVSDQIATVQAAATNIGSEQMPLLLRSLAARLNVLTQITVMISGRDRLLASLPATLHSGIFIGLATALIPRVLWPGKPTIGDTAAHAKIFFEFEGNAFAVTPIGDLFLNYGPAGIVPGMAFLGLLLGAVYAALMSASPLSPARGAIYAVVLTQVSMESFFATIIPTVLRVGVVMLTVTFLANVLVRKARALRMARAPEPRAGRSALAGNLPEDRVAQLRSGTIVIMLLFAGILMQTAPLALAWYGPLMAVSSIAIVWQAGGSPAWRPLTFEARIALGLTFAFMLWALLRAFFSPVRSEALFDVAGFCIPLAAGLTAIVVLSRFSPTGPWYWDYFPAALIGLSILALVLMLYFQTMVPTRQPLIRHENLYHYNRGAVFLCLLTPLGFYAIERISAATTQIWLWRVTLGASILSATGFSESESAKLALLVMTLVCGLLLIGHRRMLYVLGALAAALVLAFPFLLHWSFGTLRATSWLWNFRPNTFAERLQMWNANYEVITRAPIVGHGVEFFRSFTGQPALDGAVVGQVHAHSFIMQSWLDLGIIGVLIIAAAIAAGFIALRHLARPERAMAAATFSGMLAVWAVSHGMWQAWYIGACGVIAITATLAIRRAALEDAAPRPVTS